MESAAGTGSGGRAPLVALAAVLLGMAVFFTATIRPGHVWLDDFASYVAHADNIVDGRAYEDTGYLYNPDNPVAGPRAYPPVYPLLLAPVVAARGLDLDAMKLQIVALLVLLLGAIFAVIRRRHGPWVALAVTAAVGFSPFVWSFKDNVLSDVPFALFAVVALLLLDHAEQRPSPWLGAAIGLAIFLAYGTRTVGIVLVPAMLGHLWLKHRRVPAFAWIAAGVALMLAGIMAVVLPGGSGYTDQLALASPRLALDNLWRYLRSLEGLTVNGYWSAGGKALWLLVTALAVAGYLWSLPRARRTVVEVLVPLYVIVVAVWPAFQSLRFLIVLIPFYALYAILGLRMLAGRLAPGALIALALVVVASYAGVYARLDYGPLPEGVGTDEARAFLSVISTQTPENALVVFQRPKALSLYTGRRSTPYAPGSSDQAFAASIERVGATHLASGPFDDFLAGYAARNPAAVREIYAGTGYRIWRIENP